MKGAMFYGKEDLRVEEVPEPLPGPGQVKLRNAFNGICGTDLHLFFSPEASGVDYSRPNPLTGAVLPQPLGHEFSGTVVEVGENVTSVRVGDRAAIYPTLSCGECVACRHGLPVACRKLASLGANANGGGMSEFTVVDESKLHLLPDGVDLKMGALVEPMTVAWHAVARSGVGEGGTALIAGAGPIGIGVWFALKARRVTKVLVSEPNAERRSILAGLGAEVIDPANDDLAAGVADLTDGDGVDAAFDAAGAGPAFTSALANLTPGGRVVVVAVHERPVDFLPTLLVVGETEIIGSLGYQPEEFDEVIAAMANGIYDTRGWVQEAPLDSAADAIRGLRGGAGTKVLLRAD